VGLNVRYEITVPRNFSVRVEGLNVDVNVDGVQGGVVVENMEGAVRLSVASPATCGWSR
jgi:hypothetical protein